MIVGTRKPPAKRELVQLMKYLVAGGSAALVEWTVFYCCTSYFRIFYLISVAIAFAVATFLNYILSARFVFGHGYRPPRVEVILVYIVSAIGLGLNLLFMWILYDRLKIAPMISKIFSTGIVFFWNYSLRRFFIFDVKHRHASKTSQNIRS